MNNISTPKDDFWKDVIEIVELTDHLNYQPTIDILKSKYDISLLSTGKEVEKEDYGKAKAIVDKHDAEQKRLHQIKLYDFQKELEEYFKTNKVVGYEIKSFELRDEFRNKNYEIIPADPPLEECYSGENNEDIKVIADRHEIKAQFVYWMYHK